MADMRKWIDVTEPQVGDMADRKDKDLDPRPVAEVYRDGLYLIVRLQIGDTRTSPLPADLYTYRREVDVYPEHERMMAVQEKSRAIGEFLETGKQVLVTEITDDDCGNPFCDYLLDSVLEHHYHPVGDNAIETVLAEHFGIDLTKIEEEKQEMLDKTREGQS